MAHHPAQRGRTERRARPASRDGGRCRGRWRAPPWLRGRPPPSSSRRLPPPTCSSGRRRRPQGERGAAAPLPCPLPRRARAPLPVSRAVPPLPPWRSLGRAVSMARIRIHSLVFGPFKLGYADTSQICIRRVSSAYPYRIRLRHGIRAYPGVSVFLSLDSLWSTRIAPHHLQTGIQH